MMIDFACFDFLLYSRTTNARTSQCIQGISDHPLPPQRQPCLSTYTLVSRSRAPVDRPGEAKQDIECRRPPSRGSPFETICRTSSVEIVEIGVLARLPRSRVRVRVAPAERVFARASVMYIHNEQARDATSG